MRQDHDERVHLCGSGYSVLLKKKIELRQKAATDGAPCRSIVAESMNGFPAELQPALSQQMAVSIVRAKHKTRLQERYKGLRIRGPFPFDESWFDRSEDDPYILFFEHTKSRGTILIVTCGVLLDELLSAERWAADGTFRTAPQGFRQLYVLNCFKRNRRLACAWVCMQKQTRDAYRVMFKQFDTAVVKKCVFDFEIAARDAFHDVFLDAQATGGFFHLEQSIKKHARDGPKSEKSATSYRQLYRSDAFYRRLSRMLAGLAFVPEAQVKDGWKLIVEEVAAIDGDTHQGSPRHCYRQLLRYFERYYIGQDGLLAEDPLFPIAYWNLCDRLTKEEEISNAGLESGNARWNQCVGAKNPEFATIVQKLALIEMPHFRILRRELLVGNAKRPEKETLKWARFHANIRSNIADLQSGNITLKEFLYAVSCQITVVADVSAVIVDNDDSD